jgi:hypothetical protein
LASAWVTCQACRQLVVFHEEKYRDNRAYCVRCYDEGRAAATAKVVAKMDKASGFKSDKKPKPSTPEKCETCSGNETRCAKCGGMLCRPVSGEECEQRRHGRICLDCYEKLK